MTHQPVYLDAVLEPPRSLSPRGYERVMLTMGSASFILGGAFLLAGAWPITGFLGLEVLLLWALFRLSFRAQSARTFVRVTAEAVDVRKVDAGGRERCARLPSHFTRVVLDPTAPGPFALRLAHAGRAYALGEFLNPEERTSLAARLSAALDDARRERHAGDTGVR
jgi:uncharacterized membrane protein